MRNSQGFSITILLIVAVVLIAGVGVYVGVNNRMSESAREEGVDMTREAEDEAQNENQLLHGTEVLSNLEDELTKVQNTTGGITPKRYTEIEQELQALEEEGVAEESINRVRELLRQIDLSNIPVVEQEIMPEDSDIAQNSEDDGVEEPPASGEEAMEDNTTETEPEVEEEDAENQNVVQEEEAEPSPRPTLSLLWDKDPYDILPMGETESHGGEPHAGIDFFFYPDTKILTAVGGEVIYVEQRGGGEAHPGVWDVFVRTGDYTTGYTELDRINPDIVTGTTVERGEWIGDPNYLLGDKGMIHWEFGYHREGWQFYSESDRVPHPDRLCPMTYFDESSRQTLDAIWEESLKTWELKDEFPFICSGIYEGKDE